MAAKGYPVLITSTYRDDEKQNALYAQGRTKPGSIVTNAKAGQSLHNYRLAFDICKNIRGQEFNDAKFFSTAGAIGREMGLTWGGDWKSPDRPHFEFTNGLTLAQLQKGNKVPESTVMKWEKESDNMAYKEITTVDEALAVLKNKGVISGAEYWLSAVGVVKFLRELIIKFANYANQR
jgi:peptidoglycan L-alanyl-D-glutamate endopeptidase CwlK